MKPESAVIGPTGGMRGRLLLKPKNLLRVLIYLVIVVGIVAGIIYWRHSGTQPKTVNSYKPQSPSSFENLNQSNLSNYLKNKDYTSYQNMQSTVAIYYISAKDYKDAQQLMDQVLANVPASKVSSATYSRLVDIAVGQGDKSKEIAYQKKLVTAYTNEGQTLAAQQIQKQIDAGQ